MDRLLNSVARPAFMLSIFLLMSAAQLVYDMPSNQIPLDAHPKQLPPLRIVTKRIAIVGGGTAGLTMLKTLVTELPSETRQDWEIVLFEQRDDVGGIWCSLSSTRASQCLLTGLCMQAS